jgi:uncharacterized protein YndB with AHSA1/START domain
MIRFSLDVEIARPPHEVFAFVTDPAHLAEWQPKDEVTQLTPGPIGQGTRFREVTVLLGRRLEQITEFAVYDPGRRLDVRVVEGPIPLDGRWDFEESAGGTRLRFTALGEAPRRVRLLEPLMAAGTRANFRRYHRKLKRAIEGRDR